MSSNNKSSNGKKTNSHYTDAFVYINECISIGVGYIKLHKPAFLFLLSFFIYLLTVIIIFSRNPYNAITDSNSGLSIFMSMFGGFLMIIWFLFYQKNKQLYENESSASTYTFLGKIFLSIISILLIIALLYFVFTISGYMSDFSSIFIYVINFLIFIGIFALIIKTFGLSGDPGESNPSWIKLIWKIIKYLPCLFIEIADYINNQFKITTTPIITIFIIEILLIGIYFTFNWIMDLVMTHNASQLVKKPSNLNQENNLGTFQKLNFKDDKFQYKYAVSSWIYIDSFPPETNHKYDEFTSLLNIGNKPNILFNVLKNEIKIITQTEGNNEKILYKSTAFKMQKWNHIVINYDGLSMDIFINNELVSTTEGAIPYNDNTQITSGNASGIYGGICNVLYFNDNITRGKIEWLYNSVKLLNPPVI